MIISIGGDLGSGKSTIAKKLAAKLGWPRYYMGDIMRTKARERNMTLAEYMKLAETDDSIDKEVDEYQKELGLTKDDFIIEGRTSWHFIPHSLKLYLAVDEKEGARRIFKQLQKENDRNEDENLNTLEDVIASMRKRKQSEIKRYTEYFNIDIHNLDNYDYVLDTTNLSIKEAFDNCYTYIEKQLKNKE